MFCAYVCAYVCLCVWCLEKIAEATRKFAALQSDLSTSEELQPEVSSRLRRRSVVATTLVRRRKKAGSVSERVVYKSMNDIKLALSEFYLSLILLQNYQSLNFTGFCKILKKHDKVVSLYQRQWIDNHTVYWQDCPRGKLLVLHLLRIESFDYHCARNTFTHLGVEECTVDPLFQTRFHREWRRAAELKKEGEEEEKICIYTMRSIVPELIPFILL